MENERAELLIELRKEFLNEAVRMNLENRSSGLLQAAALIERRLEAMGIRDYVTAPANL